jgi:hypothetical protein
LLKKCLFTSTEPTFMTIYTNAMNFALNSDRDAGSQNFYLEVDYQVDDSQVTVRAVQSSGRDITSALSNDDLQAIGQQIEDKVQDVDGGY